MLTAQPFTFHEPRTSAPAEFQFPDEGPNFTGKPTDATNNDLWLKYLNVGLDSQQEHQVLFTCIASPKKHSFHPSSATIRCRLLWWIFRSESADYRYWGLGG